MLLLIKIEILLINLVNLGAKEILNYNDLLNENLDCLMMCVTNTPVAISIAEMIAPIIKRRIISNRFNYS